MLYFYRCHSLPRILHFISHRNVLCSLTHASFASCWIFTRKYFFMKHAPVKNSTMSLLSTTFVELNVSMFHQNSLEARPRKDHGECSWKQIHSAHAVTRCSFLNCGRHLRNLAILCVWLFSQKRGKPEFPGLTVFNDNLLPQAPKTCYFSRIFSIVSLILCMAGRITEAFCYFLSQSLGVCEIRRWTSQGLLKLCIQVPTLEI